MIRSKDGIIPVLLLSICLTSAQLFQSPPPSQPNSWTRSLSFEVRGGQSQRQHHQQQTRQQNQQQSQRAFNQNKQQLRQHQQQQQQHPRPSQVQSRLKEVEFTVKSPISQTLQPVFHRIQGVPKEKAETTQISVTSATGAVKKNGNLGDDNILSASQVREIRLKWSDKVESLRDIQDGNYDDRMVSKDKMMDNKMKMMVDDKREKRFLDPDGALDSSFVEAVDSSLNLNTTEEAVLGVDYSDDEEDEEDEEGAQDEDPHKDGQQFCVDISEYLELKWVIKDEEECHVEFNSVCETKQQNVCIDVTETKCEVVPYKECKMGLEPQEYEEKKLAPKLFVEKSCYQGKKTIPHKKLFPECRNVTKQNCVTLWETDDNGQQIWAGTDQCEPVTWQECELVEKDVQFIVPDVTCADKQELWYHEPEPTKGTKMTKTFTCEVKKSSHCTTQTRPDCKQITFNQCKEVPVSTCKTKKFHIPTQELLHRKKCLLPDDIKFHSQEADDGYGHPLSDPLSSYGKGGQGRGGQGRGGRHLRPRIPRQSGVGAHHPQGPLFL